jgi:FlaA1/EpsC-like NDP-sugar epimerase
MFAGKTILITGGTGSFGKHILKEVLKRNPKEVRIFSRDEKKQDDLRHMYPEQKNLHFIIGNVRDAIAVDHAMKKVDYVFHAAALKQVPSSEHNVFEAIRTNVLGAKNIIEKAMKHNVEKVIAISTDKAVEPVNVMGMTKALQEKLFIAANMRRNGPRTVFTCVRYGNVLGSRGSILPLFRKQISEQKSITVTNGQMTRFVLTLDQAIDLVFYAVEHAFGGEIFVSKLPAHSVQELADVLLEQENVVNKEIKVIGIRPGEKIHETLVSPTESIRTVDRGDYFIILPVVHVPEIDEKYGDVRNVPYRFSSDTTQRLTKEELVLLINKV